MAKCQLCSYPTNDKQMMVNHFRDRHGFSQVEGKGRGTVLRRCIFKGKVPTKGGKIELPSPLRLILNKKNEPVNLQGCKLGNWPIVSKIVSDGDPSNSHQGIVEEEAKRLHEGEEIKKNQEESFYECSECDYASMNEHALFDHVESTHVNVDTEGLSKSALGMKPNSGVDKNGTNISPFQCDMKANNDSVFNEVVLQYNVGREEPAEVPEPQFMSNEDSDDDLDAFIAVEGTEDSPTLATDLKAHIKEDHVNAQASGGGEGCRDFLPPRTAFKCDLCDYTASGSIGLKYSSSHGNHMRQHYSKCHPPPPNKPISRTGNGKWEWGMGQAAVRDKSKSIPKQKCRQRRDLDNSKERLRRLDEKIQFDLLKDNVPKLKDVNTASKTVILKEATEYARLLGDTALALTKEREREARRNVELRQILASAKMEYFETEIKAENGGADDSGFSSETGEGGLDLNELGANDYIPTVESALTMF